MSKISIRAAELERPRRDCRAGACGLFDRPAVAALAARLHPAPAPTAAGRRFRRQGSRGLCAGRAAQGAARGAALFARRRSECRAARRRPRADGRLRALRARAWPRPRCGLRSAATIARRSRSTNGSAIRQIGQYDGYYADGAGRCAFRKRSRRARRLKDH